MTRLIARLDIKSDKLIKGINFEGLRIIGNPYEFANKYYEDGIDEILYIDTVATLYGRNNLKHILNKTSEKLFIPVTAGGGVSNITNAQELLDNGADKIFVNSSAVREPNILRALVDKFGSANIVSSIEAKNINNEWLVYIDNGREKTNYKLEQWLEIVQDSGVGEILITSIDFDGTKKGFDINLFENIENKINVPYVISGGMGTLEHLKKIKEVCRPSGIAIGTSIHYQILKIHEIKKIMLELGFKNVRY
tara:strand:+ start:117 stop:869 length:753 start_codon:yes stop_codon:yes gene_type:complete